MATTDWQLGTPAADVAVTFEGSAASYQRYVPPAWVRAKPSTAIANNDHAGPDHVTDAELRPDPYAALPSDWTAQTWGC